MATAPLNVGETVRSLDILADCFKSELHRLERQSAPRTHYDDYVSECAKHIGAALGWAYLIQSEPQK